MGWGGIVGCLTWWGRLKGTEESGAPPTRPPPPPRHPSPPPPVRQVQERDETRATNLARANAYFVSSVLVLTDMITAEVLADDGEHADVSAAPRPPAPLLPPLPPLPLHRPPPPPPPPNPTPACFPATNLCPLRPITTKRHRRSSTQPLSPLSLKRTQVLGDVRAECEQFGAVVEVFIPRPAAGDVHGIGKVRRQSAVWGPLDLAFGLRFLF